MSAPQFWTIVLLVALPVTVGVIARRTLARRSSGQEVVERMRRMVENHRGPVDLNMLPRALVDRAIAAARPAPGGRALPQRFRLRCGTVTYADVSAVRDEVLAEFGRGCLQVARLQGWSLVEPTVVVELDDGLPPTTYRFEPTRTPRRSPRRRRATEVMSPSGTPGRAPGAEWTVLVPGRGPRPVPQDTPLTVGAGRGCSIVLDNPFVSAVHVTLSVRDGDLVVRDGGPDGVPSTNGTSVDGRPVRSTTVAAETGVAVVALGATDRPAVVLRVTRGPADRSGDRFGGGPLGPTEVLR